MAEGGSLLRCDEDFLTCTLCLDTFSDPRALPCLHTFCFKCLSNLLSKNYSSPHNNQKLKCPLCQEVHSIPSKGASGFRQDFRIKSLIDKMDATSIGSKSKGEMCKRHPKLPLDFYCTNARCKRAICKTCWTTDHQSHMVTPCVIGHGMMNEIDTCRDLLETNINEIIIAKEMLSKSTIEANCKIRKDIEKSIDIMYSFKDKLLQNVKEQSDKEMDKLTSELDRCLNMQEELNTKNHTNNLGTFAKEQSYLRKLKENAASWNLIYSKPFIKGNSLSKVDFLTIEFQNEVIGKREENGLADRIESSGSLHDRKHHIAQNVPAKEEFVAPPPRVDYRTQDYYQEPAVLHFPSFRLIVESNLLNHALSVRGTLSRSKAHYMTCSPDYGLFLVQDNYLTKLGKSPFTYLGNQRSWFANGPVGIIRSSGQDCFVEFDLTHELVAFSPAQNCTFPFPQTKFSLKCKKQMTSFSCAGGFVLYTHVKNGQTFVTALSAVDRLPPNVIWTHCVPVNNLGPVCAASDEEGYPFLLCVDIGSRQVLRAVSDAADNEDHTLWMLTCSQLDTVALDIIDIVFDGWQFFLLNRCGNASIVYIVSKDGRRQGKVLVNSQPLVITGARKMAVDQQSGQLFISTENDQVHVFNIHIQI